MKNLYRFLMSILSGLMLSAGWVGMGGVFLLAAIVPLMAVSRSYDGIKGSFWKMYLWVAIALGLWSGITTWWIWYAAAIGAILSVLITCVLMGGVVMLWHCVRRRSNEVLASVVLICGWIAAEYIYTVGEISFPWLTLGNGFARDVKLVQWYEYTGVFGGSLWVLLSNVLIDRMVVARSRGRVVAAALAILLPAGASLVRYYTYKEQGPVETVTVVQPNIDPYREKFVVSQDRQTSLMLALSGEAPDDAGFVVMPETAIDEGLWEESLGDSRSLRALGGFSAGRDCCPLLITGATTYRTYANSLSSPTARTRPGYGYWYDVYNSALAVDCNRIQVRHKSKLVVGVEKMPYYGVLKHLEFLIVDLGGISGQLGFDPAPRVFESRDGAKSGVAICFESIYGEYMTGFAKNGAGLVCVITNDGWWRDTQGYRQHFSFARLRAIEMRRDIARSANTGISGFINQRGDVGPVLGWDRCGTLTSNIHLNYSNTFYTFYGDAVARVAALVFALSVLYYVAFRIRRRNHIIP